VFEIGFEDTTCTEGEEEKVLVLESLFTIKFELEITAPAGNVVKSKRKKALPKIYH